jgi:hypothetical protein
LWVGFSSTLKPSCCLIWSWLEDSGRLIPKSSNDRHFPGPDAARHFCDGQDETIGGHRRAPAARNHLPGAFKAGNAKCFSHRAS